LDRVAAEAPAMLDRPLPDLAAWVAHFQATAIPVLACTAQAVAAMREREDHVDANLIGETIAADPLMTLRVLAHAAVNRPARVVTDTGTVTAAVVMMGIGPFFRAFGTLPTVEERLRGQDQALHGALGVLRRSHRAASLALGFAVHRMDLDAALIHQAALLHDFAELLLWCHAPALALEVVALQGRAPTMRSAAVQRLLLGIELQKLQSELMRAWKLHELLVKTATETHDERPSVRTVALAVRMARHSMSGWANAALGEDFSDAAGLLNLSVAAVRALVLDIVT
jgi:HD-like signal output (HDOD) protein